MAHDTKNWCSTDVLEITNEINYEILLWSNKKKAYVDVIPFEKQHTRWVTVIIFWMVARYTLLKLVGGFKFNFCNRLYNHTLLTGWNSCCCNTRLPKPSASTPTAAHSGRFDRFSLLVLDNGLLNVVRRIVIPYVLWCLISTSHGY